MNRRRQPFQGCSRPKLSVDSARHSAEFLPDFVLLIGAKMEPSCKNLSLPRFASNRHGFELAIQQGHISTDWFRQLTTQATAVKDYKAPVAP